MKTAHRMIIGATLCMALGFAGCASTGSSSGTSFPYKNMAVADGSAVAGEGRNVLFKGSPLMLSGTGIKVGDTLRDAVLTQTDLSPIGHHRHKGQGQGPDHQRRAVARHPGVRTADPLSEREE